MCSPNTFEVRAPSTRSRARGPAANPTTTTALRGSGSSWCSTRAPVAVPAEETMTAGPSTLLLPMNSWTVLAARNG